MVEPPPGPADNPFTALFRAHHACVRVVTTEEDEASRAVEGAAGALGLDVQTWTAVRGVRRTLVEGGAEVPGTENPAGAMVHWHSTLAGPAVLVMFDLAPFLEDARTCRALRELVDRARQRRAHVVMIDHRADVPALVESISVRVDLPLPDSVALEAALRRTLRSLNRDAPVEVQISRRSVQSIVHNLRGLTERQAEQVIRDVVASDRRFDREDVGRVIGAKRRLVQGQGLLELVDGPSGLDEIGGLRRLKAWLLARRNAGDEMARGLFLPPNRGILLLGVQGAGKSLCAKAVAGAWNRPLLRLDAGALYDRYVGESERRLREAFRQANATAPAILWIDEIEKAFASAASRSTDGGLSQRMFGALLTWMQERREEVFLVATANDIEALPPELLRKGRFDEIFFVDLPGPNARREIFEIHLRRRGLDPAAFGMEACVRESEGFSGAEIEQAVVGAAYDALARRVAGDSAAVPTADGLVGALRASPPLSVTVREKVEALREWAAGRCVPADD